MRKRRLVFYPPLAAAYPVLALAALNPGEIPGLWVLRWPLVISLLVCIVAWLLLTVSVRDPDRRAFITLLVVVLFSSYGYFTASLEGLNWAAPYAHTVAPLLFITAYLAAVVFVVFRLVTNLHALTRFLTTFTAILVLWATVEILRDSNLWTSLAPASPKASATPASPVSKPDPDIYLIVLDKYTGSWSLKKNFGFDNSDFESFLVDRGFVLPRNPQSNYIFTDLSLAALLNYRYIDSLPAEASPGRAKAYLNRLVEDNAVQRFLQSRNYRFIFFPTEFPITAQNRFADLQLPNPRDILSEFESAWRRTTLVEPVLSWVCRHISCAGTASSGGTEAQLLEWKFGQLSQLPKRPREGRPLFVFAHLTIPHEPYIFNADCSVRPPLWPPYYAVKDDTPEKQAYVAQITCLNRRLKAIVGHLLDDSPTAPVIILQADHGHGRLPHDIPDITSVTPDRIAERADVFAAYRLPAASGNVIQDSITPVNVFRTVFRQYFHADLAPLPNKTYWSPGDQLFKFTKVK